MAANLKEGSERWDQLSMLVRDQVSLNEIRRTMGVDPRTVKRHFPDYVPLPVGFSEEAAEIRETNRKLNEFIRRGKIQSNRDAGFNQRSDVL